MSRRTRSIAVLFLCAAASACASSGGGGSSRAHVKAPELLTTTRPEIVVTGATPNGARPTTIAEIQVVVTSGGRADMSTLKISGPGAETNRNAITSWVQEARFKPGTQDGEPVSAMYRQSFTAMTRAVRVR